MAIHSLFYPPSPASGNAGGAADSGPGRDVLIFFISGNPGLIDYYEPFFLALRQLFDSSPSFASTRIHIYGQDLAGFDDEDHEPFSKKHPPYDVEYQIRNSLDALSRLRVPPCRPGSGEAAATGDQPYDDVLVMGHSVGSYIALEIFHRLAARQPDAWTDATRHLHLRAGLLLFPTIEHIRLSPQGVRLDLLRRTPVLGPSAHLLAWGFLRLWTRAALQWFVGAVLGFPPHAAAATARFLRSRDGVWQALHMGMDEMRVIGPDRWEDTLWREVEKVGDDDAARAGDGEPQHVVPRFFFLYGKDDHWVASHLRDSFIARRRQQRPSRVRMMVDEGNVPHAFCLRHSETVAEKVFLWINEIYEEN